ncbi:hypothetical protein OJF2_01800 [Aquisphaera giovannonii]|uniref:Uncharacterized protein n=1 Tax=Aquisphaera giovannonii TaxID=406548 RepID=A0A5B9VVB1_9BACT|nr:hypothetical protein OJF2_01800 [Aquisphaera giovannonii]
MAKRAAEPLKSRDIRGVKYVEQLLPMLDALWRYWGHPSFGPPAG